MTEPSFLQDYTNVLCCEIKNRIKNHTYLETIYIGGGTPSVLKPERIREISESVYKSVQKSPSEFTFELNPDDVSKDLLQILADSGVTRISMGVQSLNQEALSYCRRRSSVSKILSSLDLIKQKWKGELSLDLISGLPCETENSFLQGLSLVSGTGADHISLYALTIEDETPLGKMINDGSLAYDFEFADKMWLLGRDFLTSRGFTQYEVSNFCKNDKKSLHNMAYWSHKSYIGCGSGATGTFYNQDGTAFRWTNTRDIKKYIDFWKNFNPSDDFSAEDLRLPCEFEHISREDSIFEFFMMGLRTLRGVSKNDFEKYFSEPLPQKFIRLMQKWSDNSLASVKNCDGDVFYALNERGILYLNKFLSEL